MNKKALFLLMLVGAFITSCAESVENGQDSNNPPLQTADVNQACVNLDKSFMTNTRANDDIITFPENYGGAYIENGHRDGTTAYMCKITNINSQFSLTMY